MSEHPLLGVSGNNWWLRRGQRMIRGGLSVVMLFALGRPSEFMVEGVKESYEVYDVKFEEYHLEVV